MYKICKYLLLPMMWANLTIAENLWTLFTIPMARILYVITLVLALYVGICSPYKRVVIAFLFLAIGARLIQLIGGGYVAHTTGLIAFAVIFAMAGALLYGREPAFLHKQFIVYLGLSIPVMILQMLGVSSLLMGWNTGYLHVPEIFSVADTGTFKDFQLYPTLFVGIDELQYSYGQARPVGLLYGSNPLSVFVSIAVALNLAITTAKRITYSDIIVTLAIVLTMSKLVFLTTIIWYSWALVMGKLADKQRVIKLIVLLLFLLSFYYFLFPGLFIAAFSEGMIMESIMLRLTDVLRAIGVEDVNALLGEQLIFFDRMHQKGVSYSTIAILLKSKYLLLIVPTLIVVAVFYALKLREMMKLSKQVKVYISILCVCVLTQFAVPFVMTASFQLILGFSLYPFLTNMWKLDSMYLPFMIKYKK